MVAMDRLTIYVCIYRQVYICSKGFQCQLAHSFYVSCTRCHVILMVRLRREKERIVSLQVVVVETQVPT